MELNNHENLEKSASDAPMLPKDNKMEILVKTKNGSCGKILLREDTVLNGINGCGNGKFYCSQSRNFMCCSDMSARKYYILMSLLTSVLAVSLIGVVQFCFTNTLDKLILSNMALTNNSIAYTLWKKPSVKPIMKVHIFNYTNVERVMQGLDEKLRVQDVGPYVYEETLEKVNLEFANEEERLSFQESASFEFRPELSGGTQHDKIVVPSIPLLSATALVRSKSQNNKQKTIFESIFSTGSENLFSAVLKAADAAEPFLKLPAHKFIWGYDDKIYSKIKMFLQLSRNVNMEQFGLLALKNGTSEDVLTINTGSKNLDLLNMIESIDGEPAQKLWSTDECNSFEATDGSLFPVSQLNRKKTLQVFNKNVCRKLPFNYIGDVEAFDGLTALRYEPPQDVFDNTKPENLCYCNMDKGVCPPNGIADISKCASDAPLWTSFPHFLYGDQVLFEDIEGLQPNVEIHKSFMDLHPSLGIPLNASMKLQINIKVKKMAGLRSMDFLKDELLMPIAWLEMSMGEIPPEVRAFIYHGTYSSAAFIMTLRWISIFLALTSFILIVITYRKRQPFASVNFVAQSKK